MMGSSKFYEEVKKDQLYHEWDENRNEAIKEAKAMLPPVQTILDVGSGEKDLGFTEMVDLGKGCDFHWLDYEDGSFDLIWARHALEHSPMPYFALREWYRVSKQYLLVVVPEVSEYIANYPGHYSCLSEEMWEALFKKSGWEVEKFVKGFWKHGDRNLPELRFLCKKF